MNSVVVIQSYVWHSFVDHRRIVPNTETMRCYLVSTVERDSSSPHAPGHRYNETLVWQVDFLSKVRDLPILLEEVDVKGSIRMHNHVCNQIHDGNYAWLFPSTVRPDGNLPAEGIRCAGTADGHQAFRAGPTPAAAPEGESRGAGVAPGENSVQPDEPGHITARNWDR
jgi:hypothetical protein